MQTESKLVNDTQLYVKGCLPHYRRPIQEIMTLRGEIAASLVSRGIALPITREVHLIVSARKHHDGGDLSNIVQAVCQALDGNTLNKAEAILVDDGQVVRISARWIP